MGGHGPIYLAICLTFFGCGALAGCGDDGSDGNDSDRDADADDTSSSKSVGLRILHTNDMHSHLWGYGPESDYTPETTGDDETVGGIARLATLIKQARAEADDRQVLLLDSGDMTQGTLFTLISTTASPELSLMKKLGYDAVALGNHEFDGTSEGTAKLVNAARDNGVSFPILASNIVFSPDDPGDDALESLMTSGKISRTAIKELSGGLKVGLLGLMGKNAADDAVPADPVTFEPIADAARTAVESLQADGAELIIALSHTGVDDTAENSEDRKLAQAVPEIDIIISGHTHTALEKPIIEGNTLIVQAGSYLSHLGVLDVDVTDGKASLIEYKLKRIDDSVLGDAEIQKQVVSYKDLIDSEVLSEWGMSCDQPVAKTDFDLTFPLLQEGNLGNLVVDAVFEAARAAEPNAPPDVAIEAAGVVRDSILAGTSGIITVSDAFRVLPMRTETGAHGGMPLVSLYFTASDLRAGAEITPTGAFLFSEDYFLAVSGMRYTYDPDAPASARVKDIYLGNDLEGYSNTPLDVSEKNTKLYKVVMNYYIAMMMLDIGSLLGLTPRDKNGDPIQDISTQLIDAEPGGDVQWLDEFSGFVSFLSSFDDADGDGVPEIPERYREPSGRMRSAASAASP